MSTRRATETEKLDPGTLGHALYAARARYGHDTYAAASTLGVSRITYSYWENHQRRPRVKNIATIADYLDATVEDVIALIRTTFVQTEQT